MDKEDMVADLDDISSLVKFQSLVSSGLESVCSQQDETERRLLGGDIAALVNASAVSYEQHGQSNDSEALRLVSARRSEILRLGYRLILMGVESGQDRYFDRVRRTFAKLD